MVSQTLAKWVGFINSDEGEAFILFFAYLLLRVLTPHREAALIILASLNTVLVRYVAILFGSEMLRIRTWIDLATKQESRIPGVYVRSNSIDMYAVLLSMRYLVMSLFTPALVIYAYIWETIHDDGSHPGFYVKLGRFAYRKYVRTSLKLRNEDAITDEPTPPAKPSLFEEAHETRWDCKTGARLIKDILLLVIRAVYYFLALCSTIIVASMCVIGVIIGIIMAIILYSYFALFYIVLLLIGKHVAAVVIIALELLTKTVNIGNNAYELVIWISFVTPLAIALDYMLLRSIIEPAFSVLHSELGNDHPISELTHLLPLVPVSCPEIIVKMWDTGRNAQGSFDDAVNRRFDNLVIFVDNKELRCAIEEKEGTFEPPLPV